MTQTKGKPIHYAYRRKRGHYPRRDQTNANLESIRRYLIEYRTKFHLSPSFLEIAKHFDWSTSTVHYYIVIMEREGLIMPRQDGVSRNIIPIEEQKDGQ